MPPSCTMVSVGGILYARTEDFWTILHNRLRSTLNPADAGTSPPPSGQSPLSSSLPSPLPSPLLFPPLFPPLPLPRHAGHAGAPNDRQILDGDNLLCDFGCEFCHCLGPCVSLLWGPFCFQSTLLWAIMLAIPVGNAVTYPGSYQYQDPAANVLALPPPSLSPPPPQVSTTTTAATSPPHSPPTGSSHFSSGWCTTLYCGRATQSRGR